MNHTHLKASTTLLMLLAFPIILLAQQNTDFMRSMGKMYVVVAVVAVTFIGIVLYLVNLDRKLTKLENQIRNHD